MAVKNRITAYYFTILHHTKGVMGVWRCIFVQQIWGPVPHLIITSPTASRGLWASWCTNIYDTRVGWLTTVRLLGRLVMARWWSFGDQLSMITWVTLTLMCIACNNGCTDMRSERWMWPWGAYSHCLPPVTAAQSRLPSLAHKISYAFLGSAYMCARELFGDVG